MQDYFWKVFHKYYNLICIFICTPICTKKILILEKSGCYSRQRMLQCCAQVDNAYTIIYPFDMLHLHI
jgi:hypothetical protein